MGKLVTLTETVYGDIHRQMHARFDGSDPGKPPRTIPNTVTPIVSRGVWIVECPDTYASTDAEGNAIQRNCGHAVVMSDGDDPFKCPRHKIWRRVVKGGQVAAIETQLSKRPVLNQNMTRTETVADLITENARHTKELKAEDAWQGQRREASGKPVRPGKLAVTERVKRRQGRSNPHRLEAKPDGLD